MPVQVRNTLNGDGWEKYVRGPKDGSANRYEISLVSLYFGRKIKNDLDTSRCPNLLYNK